MRISHNPSYFFFIVLADIVLFYSIRLDTKAGLNQKFLNVLLRLKLNRHLESLISWERIWFLKPEGIVVCRCDWRTITLLCWPMCMTLEVIALFTYEDRVNISWAEVLFCFVFKYMFVFQVYWLFFFSPQDIFLACLLR